MYHLLYCIVHKLSCHSDEESELLLVEYIKPLKERTAFLEKLTAYGFFSKIRYVPEQQFKLKKGIALDENSSEKDIKTVIGNISSAFEKWFGGYMNRYNEIYVASDQHSCGIYLINNKKSYTYMEDASGMLSEQSRYLSITKGNNRTNYIINEYLGCAGRNLCSELFMNYLNKEYGAGYDVLPILEIVDQYLVPVSLSNPWGYNSAYFLSAANNCHPNYATYLMTKHSLSMSSIGSILQQLPKEQKRFFNKQLIENIYQSYQSNAVNDIETITKLRKKFDGKEILVIAPGGSVKSKQDAIQKYISKKNPVVISCYFKCNIIQIGVMRNLNGKVEFTVVHFITVGTVNYGVIFNRRGVYAC